MRKVQGTAGEIIVKKIGNILCCDRWKNKLSVQMGMLILATNLLFLGICFFFQYEVIGRILQNNYEDACIRRFEQAEANINNFCEQIEQVSTRLSVNSDLSRFARSKAEFDIKHVGYINKSIDSFQEEITYHSYIQSILFFGDNGSYLRYNKSGMIQTNYFYDKEDTEDIIYSSEIFQVSDQSEKNLKWLGGYGIEDFGFQADNRDKPGYYIVAARNISKNAGRLIIIVPMDYVLEIFCSDNSDTSEKIYMIDGDNQIIVSKYQDAIGEIKNFSDGETIRPGVQRYEENGEHGEVQVLVYYVAAMDCYLVDEIPIVEVMRERVYLRNILLGSCALNLLLSFAFSMRWIVGLTTPLRKLMNATQKVGDGELGILLEKVPGNEIGMLTKKFNRMSLDLQDLFERNRQAEAEKREFEMQSLRAKINPHMIYNTLNTIKWMAIVNNERGIAESITLLSEFLEPVFKNKDPLCTVGEELDYLEKYIAIMNLRVAGGYVLKVDVPKEYYDYKIVRFLLQPIVENSIRHGMKDRSSGEIRVSMWAEAGDGYIQIEDDGSGMESSVAEELTEKIAQGKSTEGAGGVGVVNVSRRIRNQYGDGYGLTIRNRENRKGAKVILKIRLETGKTEK